jgi:biotin operon repressor
MTVTAERIIEIASQMLSKRELQSMSKYGKAAVSQHIRQMLEAGVEFDQKTLNLTKAELEREAARADAAAKGAR